MRKSEGLKRPQGANPFQDLAYHFQSIGPGLDLDFEHIGLRANVFAINSNPADTIPPMNVGEAVLERLELGAVAWRQLGRRHQPPVVLYDVPCHYSAIVR